MVMKSIKKALLAFVVAVFGVSGPASAYVFSFTNGTNKDIMVDFCGVLVVGCSMMQGKIMKGNFLGIGPVFNDYMKTPQTRRVEKAGVLNGPQLIPAGHTLELNFNEIDIGVCLNMTQIKVGFTPGFSMIPREVKALPNAWYATIVGAVDGLGDSIGKIGQAVGKLPGPAKAAGAAGQGVGAILGSAAKLVTSSTCKDMSFVILPDFDANDKPIENTAIIYTREIQ